MYNDGLGMDESVYIVDNPGSSSDFWRLNQSELSSDILPTELGCVSQLGQRVSNN